MKDMPEAVACRALDIIKRLAPGEFISDIIDGYYIISGYDITGFGITIFPERAFSQPTVLGMYAQNKDEKYTLEELDWR